MKESEFIVSTDDSLLNIPWVVSQIRAAYWGGWRSEDLIHQSIKNSLNFGLYWAIDPGDLEDFPSSRTQVGFARVVTDGCTFNWVCDVIVEERYRKCGLGSFLIRKVLEHPDLASGVSMLGTRDAHGFYAKFGYLKSDQMKRIPPRK
jgi:GNAT superfamily N-acetyltransferase